MLKEFKEFMMKGNVLELAVAVIMATYFGKIVNSLVNDIIMPVIGNMIGGVDFSEFKVVLKEEIVATETVEAVPEVAVYYGTFINHIITFVIVAFAIFMIVRAYNKTKKKKEEAPAAPAGPTEIELLTEIRDSLKK
ncbi:large-conductance mechanosensitive channel protein MscL [bacterium]|nr:large-conductance mechanosensitive channel protein MscL [bacterium]